MKTLFLYRHAKSSWSDPTLDDMDRPLSGRGKRAAKAMAQEMAERKIQPDLILCSPARRTRATLKRLNKHLGADIPTVLEDRLYMAGPAELQRIIHEADGTVDALMLIGHNPGMHMLARRLIGAGPAEARAMMAEKYPTAALAVILFDVEAWNQVKARAGRLVAYLLPRQLKGE